MVTDHAHGGYQMDDNEIATFAMIVAGVQLVYQVLMFPVELKFSCISKIINILTMSKSLYAKAEIEL